MMASLPVPNNPWCVLKPTDKRFTLKDNIPFIDYANSQCKPQHRIDDKQPPEPRQGPIDAPVFILQQNPGLIQTPPNLTTTAITNMLNDLCNQQAPHQLILNGNHWWKKYFKQLIADVSANCLAKSCCSVEFFPYRSLQYDHSSLRVPSQQYSFDIVRRAINNGALFIVTRGAKEWFGAIPELDALRKSGRLFLTNSTRGAFITPNNLPTGAYDKVVKAIQRNCT